MKKRIPFALILMGFTSLIVQALLIREFLITFYGNELTIGLVLACWILTEAIGSSAASRFSGRIKSPFATYSFLQILIALYLPVSIFLIRAVKDIFVFTPGEAVGFIPILASCIFIIGPLSIFDGMQFPFGCRMYALCKKGSHEIAGRVYILEAIGFILAGPIFTYIFLTRLYSIQIGLLIGLINLVSGLLLIKDEFSSLVKKVATVFIFVLIALNLSCLFSRLSLQLHDYSIVRQWKNQEIVEYKNSIYGNLAVARREEQYTFYSDGIPIINIPVPDIVRIEEFIHFGLLAHPDPKDVLFLCGGAGGLITEALRHPVEKVDYAELDPLLIALVKKFPKAITEKELRDPRVQVKIIDSVRFIKTTRSTYDCVFVNLPFPSTLQLNRYYTREFFDAVKMVLKPGGHLVVGLPGSLSYLNEELQQLNLCILTTLKNSFPHVHVIPGDNNLYISSLSPLQITPRAFLKRINERNIATRVLTQVHLDYRLKQYWQDWFYDSLRQSPPVTQNTNLVPAGLFYGISYWSSLVSPYLNGLFRTVQKLNFNYLILSIVFLAIIVRIVIKKPHPRGGRRTPRGWGRWSFAHDNFAITTSIATTGFVGMSFDLIFILLYQVFFGFIFHHIAILVTSFMAGLTLGGWFVTKHLERIKNGLAWFIRMELSVLLFCICSGLFLVYLNGVKGFTFYPLFYILSCISGILVGSEFPLANKLYQLSLRKCHFRSDSSEVMPVEKTAGNLYALDLLGAFFAALVVSIIFIPIFGVLKTCVFLAILKAAGLVLYTGVRHPNSKSTRQPNTKRYLSP